MIRYNCWNNNPFFCVCFFIMYKILRHSFIYLTGEVLSKAVPFILLPYLTRKLSVEGFGELSLYTAFQAFFAIVVNWSFEGAIARYYYRYGRHSFFSVTVCALLSSSVIFLCILLFMPGQIYKLIWFSAFLTGLFNILVITFQCQKKPLFYTVLQFLLSLLSLVLTVLFFSWFPATAQLRIVAMVLATAVSVLVAGCVVYKYNFISRRLRLDKRFLLYIIGFGFPLIFHHLNFFLKGQFDRMLVAGAFSLTSLGIYSAGFQLALVFPVLLQAVNKACVPFFYEQCKKGKMTAPMLNRLALYSLVLIPIPALFALCLPEKVYTLFLGGAYGGAKYFTCIFLLGLAFQIPYLILVNYLFYLNQNKKIALCTLSSGIVHVVLLFFLKDISIYALPFALIFSNILSVGLLYMVVKAFSTEPKKVS